MVTASDWVPTLLAISSTMDWKQMTTGSTTTDSNAPTTEETSIPRNSSDQPRRRFALSNTFSFDPPTSQTAQLCVIIAHLIIDQLQPSDEVMHHGLKQMTTGSTATTDSNAPATEETSIPRNNDAIGHGRRFFTLSIRFHSGHSSPVRPPSFA